MEKAISALSNLNLSKKSEVDLNIYMQKKYMYLIDKIHGVIHVINKKNLNIMK
jgi:hypothetical protein